MPVTRTPAEPSVPTTCSHVGASPITTAGCLLAAFAIVLSCSLLCAARGAGRPTSSPGQRERNALRLLFFPLPRLSDEERRRRSEAPARTPIRLRSCIKSRFLHAPPVRDCSRSPRRPERRLPPC